MYFRIFSIGHNLDKRIKKAGFEVNSYKEFRSYTGGNEESPKITTRMLCLRIINMMGVFGWK